MSAETATIIGVGGCLALMAWVIFDGAYWAIRARRRIEHARYHRSLKAVDISAIKGNTLDAIIMRRHAETAQITQGSQKRVLRACTLRK